MTHDVQHIYRKFYADKFKQVENGTLTFDVLLESEDLSLEQGDLLTIQEMDDEGKPTGKELIRKISYKVSTLDENSPDIPQKDQPFGLAIIGFVSPEYQSLQAVYDQGVTAHMGIDRLEEDDLDYTVFEGPFYAPILIVPQLLETGILDSLKPWKWPIGRYSVNLSLGVDLMEGENPDEVYISEAFILVASIAYEEEEVLDNGIQFEQLDIKALINGNLVSLQGDKVTALPPMEVDQHLHRNILSDLDELDDTETIGPDDDPEDFSPEDANGAITEEELAQMFEEAEQQSQSLQTELMDELTKG